MGDGTLTSGALYRLRALIPPRALIPTEARQIVERQATLLLELAAILGPAVPVERIVASFPRVSVRRQLNLPSSGSTRWLNGQWLITIAAEEPHVRQRFTLAHEFAHVIWHPYVGISLPAYNAVTNAARLEQLCELFAANLLMPRVLVKRAYLSESIQDVPSLARLFDVSWSGMQQRLEQLGLVGKAVG